ncbi:amidohydrolase [uncultured Paludibaculum sp.]|uniref:amidohydrolase n=1 Tax=uncultured Paludibaculum sp. TaxID=1765020 RepID=UPI002AAB3BE5|nr:amidohydrolase [uncultured Paludibaculum sp.]
MLPIVALLGLVLVVPAIAQKADLIVENARIYTVNPAQPSARAIAVADEKILAVGDDVSSYAGPRTRRIDAHGAALIPGLIDSHGHMRGLGGLLESRDLRHVKTVAEIAAYVKQQATGRAPGEWVVGRNWDQTNWGGQFPSAKDLDAVVTDRPVFLTRVDGHAGWANSKALALAGIDDKTPDPSGGKILRDPSGKATGILVDRAQGLVRSKIPPPTYAQIKRQLELAADECARLGLTGVHDAGVSADDLKAYKELIAEGKFPMRVYAMIGGEGALWKEYLQKGPEVGSQLTVRSIKLYADGALGSRGAALWQPYTDDKSNSGLMMTTKEDIERVARQAVERGFQVCTHAIGDRANRTVLDAYAAALGGHKNDKRFRVEHAQVISLPDFQMFADNSVIASMQATHATSDMRWIDKRIGPDRVAGAYAWQRFLKLGVPVADGSDFPVEEPNPMLGLYAAITRQDVTGQPPGGWTPGQRMSRPEALKSWTLAGAYAAFEEKIKGSLEKGKLADFVILDHDVMTVPALDIVKTKVRMTVVGGKVVYEQK